MTRYPSYLKLYENGELEKKAKDSFSLLESCVLCPRECKINRIKNEKGYCRTGYSACVYSYMPHLGEEPPISGFSGSGTIFFSGCNMSCVYCQNYKFSQIESGREADACQLAQIMLELQNLGCHNINLVTPTHVMPQILRALLIAVPQGLRLPLVYNTGGYELPRIIKLLGNIVDIFLVDMRYATDEMSRKYSNAPDYPEYNQAAVKEMHRQVGIALIDKSGIINKGMIIRHLVLPENISGAARIMQFIAEEISPKTYVSLMSQYLPCHRAGEYPALNRRISEEEYKQAKDSMSKYGLSSGWMQESRGLSKLAGINIEPR